MDPRLLRFYNSELQFIREMGGEFARQYPKVAGRLGLEGFECADPYVERLLEGFAFLAARVQLKLDAEYPRFTQHLLECIYPHYLAPLPSMTVVQLQPDHTQGSLLQGFTVPRNTALRTVLGKGDRTACEYRTAHALQLWPIEISEAAYFPYPKDVANLGIPERADVKAALRIRLKLRGPAGTTFSQLRLDRLSVYLRGTDQQPMRLYEQLLGNAVGLCVRPVGAAKGGGRLLASSHLAAQGFDDGESLLPVHSRTFQGYRLLREYFAFPERFRFVLFDAIGDALRSCGGSELELIALFNRTDPALQNAVDTSNFALFCTPAINLFHRRADRIHVTDGAFEYHVVADRTRSMDFEVFEVSSVTGYGVHAEDERSFQPFYSSHDQLARRTEGAFFTVRREPRRASDRQRLRGSAPRSSYVGNETFLALVDAREAPFSSDLKQLGLELLCTNRDLPLHITLGQGRTDFTLDEGAPVAAVRAVAGPTPPRASVAGDATAWRLIRHLSLNYASLFSDGGDGATNLREMLTLYGDATDAAVQKQVEGIRALRATSVVRRIPLPGPIAFGRGVRMEVTCDETGFEGTGTFLLGAVLERFFARLVSINSFTETALRTTQRDEIMRWPPRIGTRALL